MPRPARQPGARLTLQDTSWSREKIRELVSACNEEKPVTAKDLDLFGRLRSEYLPAFLLKLYSSPDWPRRVFALWLEGKSSKEIVELCDRWIPRITVDTWIDDCTREQVVLAFLAGRKRRELEQLADELGTSVRTMYRMIEEFVGFASATIAREAFSAQCRAPVSGNLLPSVVAHTCAGRGCVPCGLNQLFDRCGRAKHSSIAFVGHQLRELAMFGVRAETFDRHEAALVA